MRAAFFLLFLSGCVASHPTLQNPGHPPHEATVLLVSDTHYGGRETGGVAEDDCDAFLASAIRQQPDHILHLGDITDSATAHQWSMAKRAFRELTAHTPTNRVWAIPGGNHDGLCQVSRKRRSLGFYETLKYPSQFYVLTKGNLAFVMLGYTAQPGQWSSGEYGGTDRADIMGQARVDWLARTLDRLNGYNVIICHHFPLNATTAQSISWANCSQNRRVYECNLIRNVLAKHSNVVGWFHGHVHVDSDTRWEDPPAGDGTITVEDGIAHVNVGCIWKEHGPGYKEGHATFASYRLLDLIEGAESLTLRAWDANHDQPARLSLSGGENLEVYSITVPYPLVGMDEPLILWEQAWDVSWHSRKKKQRWWRDASGLVAHANESIRSCWDKTTVQDWSSYSLEAYGTNTDALRHVYFASDDGVAWDGPYEGLKYVPPSRWLRVDTTFSGNVDLMDLSLTPAASSMPPTAK